MTVLEMPQEIRELFKARQSLLKRYSHITNRKGEPRLGFTFDGNLVGDIGEALAVEYFGVTLDETRSWAGATVSHPRLPPSSA